MEIGIPPNGYWTQLAFGKSVYKERFWESKTAKQEISLWLRIDEDGEEYISSDTSLFIKNKAEIIQQLQSVQNLKIQNPDHLYLLEATKEYCQNQNYSADFRNYRLKSIDSPHVLEVIVSRKLLNRAMNFMSQFISLLEIRGHSITIKYGNTHALIFGQEIQILLREKINRINSKSEYNGKLCLKYLDYPEREWADGLTSLEDKLPDIIAKLEVIAYNKKLEHEEYERQREEERLLKEKMDALTARKEKELRDFKSVLGDAVRYQKAIEMRNYINTIKEFAIKNNTLTEEKRQWIEWALKKADWYDPFIEAEDELLNNVNKDTLTFM